MAYVLHQMIKVSKKLPYSLPVNLNKKWESLLSYYIPQSSETCFKRGYQCLLEELNPKELQLHVSDNWTIAIANRLSSKKVDPIFPYMFSG